jgi:hypothetical protein
MERSGARAGAATRAKRVLSGGRRLRGCKRGGAGGGPGLEAQGTHGRRRAWGCRCRGWPRSSCLRCCGCGVYSRYCRSIHPRRSRRRPGGWRCCSAGRRPGPRSRPRCCRARCCRWVRCCRWSRCRCPSSPRRPLKIETCPSDAPSVWLLSPR